MYYIIYNQNLHKSGTRMSLPKLRMPALRPDHAHYEHSEYKGLSPAPRRSHPTHPRRVRQGPTASKVEANGHRSLIGGMFHAMVTIEESRWLLNTVGIQNIQETSSSKSP